MIREEINKRQYRNIVKSINGGYIYKENGKLYKLDKTYSNDMLTRRRIFHDSREINVDQIEWLSGMRFAVVKSSLPEGLLIYDHEPVGIIYPRYFEVYNPLNDVYKEDTDLMLGNIRKAVENNLELTSHDIYNADFAAKNVLYKGSDVQLIDLDGKHIKRSSYSNYNQVYSYFMDDFFRIAYKKLVSIYGKDKHDIIRRELIKIFPNPMNGYEENTPLEVLDKLERILK